MQDVQTETRQAKEGCVPDVTSPQAAACYRLLRYADGPMTAAEVAEKLGRAGGRETRRRHVRAIVKLLRDGGCPIVADLSHGYRLPDCRIKEGRTAFCDYSDRRQGQAKKVLGEAHKRKKMLTNSKGQGLLFGQRVTTGIG